MTQQFFGRFYIGDDAKNLSIGSDSIELTTGYYYTQGYTGESAAQLCEHLQAKIRAIGASQDASTVVYSSSTGLISITLETAATITFVDAALATVLGYTSTSLSSGTIHVADRQPRYVWRPSRSAWDYPLNLYAPTFWHPASTGIVGRSNDGTGWTVAGNNLYDAALTYRFLTEAEVKTPRLGTNYADLQQFWTDVVANTTIGPQPIRCYPDRTLNSSADIVTFLWGRDGDEKIGGWLDYSERHVSEYLNLWDVQIPMMKSI